MKEFLGPIRIGVVTSVDSIDESNQNILEFSLSIGDVTKPKTVVRVIVRDVKLLNSARSHIKKGTWLSVVGSFKSDFPDEDFIAATYIAADFYGIKKIVNSSNESI